MTTETPTPGSPEAVKLGCTCPISDNGKGRGAYYDNHAKCWMFWYSSDCPVHVLPGIERKEK